MEISSAGGRSAAAAARGCYGDHSKIKEGRRSGYSAASSRCSIRHLHDLLSGFDKRKRQLVSQIGFDGILHFPPLRQVDRRLSAWLMSRVDVAMRELVIDGTRRFKFSKDDVAVVFGIPNGGRSVVGEGIPSKAMVSTIMNQYLGGTSKGNRSIKMARQVIERDHNVNMSSHEEDCFKVAFVIYIISTLLAPGATHDCVAGDYWNAIAEPSEIRMFDWCGYVMDRWLDAVGKLKSEASKCSRAPNVMGCCLFFQVMYLDSIDLGIWNMEHTNLPRFRCFSSERMRSMILADTVDDGCEASENNFGKCKMRSPFGVCYHWASGLGRDGACPMKCRNVGSWEATISVARNLRVPMEATGPLYLAIADFENQCIHLAGAVGLKFISALLSIIEPFNAGFRYSVGGCHNEFEPGACRMFNQWKDSWRPWWTVK